MMPNSAIAARAYDRSGAHRSLRLQEADVFRRVIGALQAARAAGLTAKARAIADNRRLWMTVVDLLRDPSNALPGELRAKLVSIGLAVQREMDGPAPDLDFLISVNENIAAGLAHAG
jgi:flagellar biosynthesis regulator FlaF